ncbi:uncharacterized protein LOC115229386 [Octopus sinensis]|uniref:Uncharacterized protein LOC115229386 n=1 Tax=Octopus sinensis TaxID=2607531 RepID=A0A6P7TTI9_9MOLL|nr:uncharacterized protein LOC115229386 [Octopus sinensis]
MNSRKIEISSDTNTFDLTAEEKIYDLENKCNQIASIAHDINSFVKKSAEKINVIEENTEICNQNIKQGRRELHKASLLKASGATVTGGFIGAAVGGPVGCLIGLKLGTFIGAVSGTAILAAGLKTGIWISKRKRKILSDNYSENNK